MAAEISKRISEMKEYIQDMPEAQEGLDLDSALAMSRTFEEKAAAVEKSAWHKRPAASATTG